MHCHHHTSVGGVHLRLLRLPLPARESVLRRRKCPLGGVGGGFRHRRGAPNRAGCR